MEKSGAEVTSATHGVHAGRAELAREVAFLIGSEENLSTSLPRLSLHRLTAPTAPCAATYEPSVILIPQGRKQVTLGRNVFFYDASRYLLTSIEELFI